MDVTAGARRYRDAIKALTSLVGAGHQARLAGGSVRDRLLGVEPKDYDVATTAKPHDVMRHFQAAGWRTVPTGLDHGTVTLVMPSGPVEITTLRVDVATDGRHADVAFGTSFEEDAARRDFTVNAMFEDEHGVVYDYHGGQADLAARTLRFVGEPAARIREDYLRIMRLFRFWSKLGFVPAAGTLDAVKAERQGLTRISQERISSELLQTLAGPHVDAAVRGLVDADVWNMVVPEAPLTKTSKVLHNADFWREFAKYTGARRGLLALGSLIYATIHANGGNHDAKWDALGPRLKLSVAESRALAFMSTLPLRLKAPRHDVAEALEVVDAAEAEGGADAWTDMYAPFIRLMKIVGAVDAQLLASVDDITRTEEKFGARRHGKSLLDGRRVMSELGLSQGPELGVVMDKLKRGYRNGAFTTSDEALAWIKKQRS
jgi:tRNA nucleotidyltransferase/poly(A) polymerase